MPRRIFSILRRHLKADRLLFSDFIVMRACSFYRIHNFLCVVTPESSYCERYFRSYLKCELAFLDAKTERFLKEKERLASEIAAVYTKITRFRKQYRAVIKKLRDLGNREDRNILELKINEIMISDLPEILQKKIILLEILNSPSPRFSFFFNPAFLGSSDKSVETL
jgi:hypothetical protein